MTQIERNIASVLKGKKVLFIENDNELGHGIDLFEDILKKVGVEYNILFQVDEVDKEKVFRLISEHDAIVYMTQWVYQVSRDIKDYMLWLRESKIVIEIYISEPTWYYQLEDVPHQMYIFCGYPPDSPEFYKLSRTPYWDYKNKFDK